MTGNNQPERLWIVRCGDGTSLLWEREVRLSREEIFALLRRLLCRKMEPDDIVDEVLRVREDKEPLLFAVHAQGEMLWTCHGQLYYRANPVGSEQAAAA